MQLIASRSLFALPSLFLLGSSLPFFPQRLPLLEPLLGRASYSVVAVDGGPAVVTAAGDNGSEVASTTFQTTKHTPAPTTKTVVETDTLPPVTELYLTTQTIKGSSTTRTVVITLTSTPVTTVQTTRIEPTSTVISTGYSQVNVSPNSVTSEGSGPSISASSVTSSSSLHSLSLATSASSTTSSSTSTTSSSASSTQPSPSSKTTPTTLSTQVVSSVQSEDASSMTYDDGMWHTTYPAWPSET